MDYSKLSDFEINCRVVKSLGMEYAFWFSKSEEDFDVEIPRTERGPIWQTREYLVNGYIPSNGNCFNPCNNPADAWPIIMKSRINIQFDLDETFAWGYDQNAQVLSERDRKTFRAAMIVFLMMQESE